MAADPRIEEVKTLLTAINADDVAEDTLFQAGIDSLAIALATLTAERDVLAAERVGIIAALIEQRDSLDARITALGG